MNWLGETKDSQVRDLGRKYRWLMRLCQRARMLPEYRDLPADVLSVLPYKTLQQLEAVFMGLMCRAGGRDEEA